MIKEKYISKIAYLLIIISLVLCISIYLYNKFTPETLIVPEYVEKSFDKNKVMQINIDIDEEDFSYLIENAIEEKYVKADITIDDKTIKNVGIRAKGNSSLQQVASNDETDRFSFKINFSEYIDDQNFYGLEKMVLNNMIGDTTYLKEYMSYDVMEFLDINTPAYCFANIKINNEDWGLYLAVETLEEDYLERYYGKDYGNLYKPESDQMGGGEKQFNMNGNKIPQDMKPPNVNDEDVQQDISPPNINNEGAQQDISPPNINDEDVQQDISPPNINNEGAQQDISQPNINNEDVQQDISQPNINNEDTQQDMSSPNANNEDRQQAIKMRGQQSNKETALIYIDDNISSYSKIFDSVVTKGLTDVDKNNYIKMVKALSEGKNIEKYIDIDEVLRYFAANTFLVNLDSYAGSMKHNYYLYEENGVFQILPWDFNLSFGTFQMNSGEKVINFPIDKPVTDTMENSPLISKLLEIEEYKNLLWFTKNYVLNKESEKRKKEKRKASKQQGLGVA